MRTRRAALLGVASALALAAAGTAVVAVSGSPDRRSRASDKPGQPTTVAVERTDLSTTRTMPGSLGYGAPRTIRAGGGTVTWLPAVGATVSRGQALYRNDDHPVTAFYGSTPLFRRLDATGLVGRDVRVVVDNLRALGYRTGDQPRNKRSGEAVLTRQVLRAITEWRDAVGLPTSGMTGPRREATAPEPVASTPGPKATTDAAGAGAETGTSLGIDPAEVVVLPGPVRISGLVAQVGDEATDGVLVVTGTGKAVSVPVRAGDLGSIRIGSAVTVELPDGNTTAGQVTRIDRNARIPDGAEGDDPAAAQVNVTVRLGDSRTVRNLNSAPVRVSFAGEVRKKVLAVPVAALLALREGGHAVQIAGGPLVPVETGMFAMGLVEVRGDGLTEGTLVVTAS